jgi:hypothetical protein
MKSYALVVLALVAVVGCNRMPSVSDAPMSNDMTAPAPLPRAGGLRDPSVKPVGPIKPPAPVARGGIADDTIRPVGVVGVPDDSVRPR